MSDNQPEPQPDKQDTPALPVGKISPDDLMNDFKGKPLLKVLAVVLLLHVIVIGVFSYGYIKKQIVGEDTTQLTEEELMDLAVREATVEVRAIAEKHGVNKQELANRFGDNNPRIASPASTEESTGPSDPTDSMGTVEPETLTPSEELSEIEKAITQEQPGPAVPDLGGDITKEDPIFAE